MSARTIAYAALVAGLRLRSADATAASDAQCAEWLTAASKALWETAMPLPESVTGKTVTLSASVFQFSEIGFGSFYRLFSADPRVPNQNYRKIRATNDGDGIHCQTTDTSAFVLYRPAHPRYTGTAYSGSGAYAVNDLVLFTDGIVYRCVAATSAGQSPANTAAKWEAQPVLLCMEEALKVQARGEIKLDASAMKDAAGLFERAQELLEDQWLNFARRFPYAIEQP